MTAFSDKISRDSARTFEKLGTTFKWQGKSYACSVTYGAGGIEAEDVGGFFLESAITISTLTSLFTGDRPEENQLVEVEGATWIIDKDPLVVAGTPFLIFPCSDPDGHTTISSDQF